jgi:lipopolysaccharide export system permease protein
VFRILDRHVLREWLTIFLIVLGATYGLLLMRDLTDAFPDLIRLGAPAREIFFYFVVRAPGFLSDVLPIAVLVSLLYALGQLHRNNEIVAMRSAGLSVPRIAQWLWVAVTVLSVLVFFLNSSIVPWSVEASRLLKTNLEFAAQEKRGEGGDEIGLEYNLGYENRSGRRLWHISRFGRYSHEAGDVQVSILNAQGTEIRRILASRGIWDEARRGWTFLDGVEVVDLQSGDNVRPVPFKRLDVPEFHEDPEWMVLLLKDPKNLSLYELGRIIESPDTEGNPKRAAYAVRYHWLLASTFGCLIAAGLAVPFAVSGVRVNPAVGVSKALGLFLCYWMMFTVCRLLGEQEALAPWVAAWLPSFIMAGVAVWLNWRAR